MQLLIHDLACTEWKPHSRFYELMKAFHLLLFDGSLIFPECILLASVFFWWSIQPLIRDTLVIFHLFNKFSNEHNCPILRKNLWLAFREISICSTLCIPLSVEYIECTEMARTDFLLFVLTATLGGIFLCGANDWFNNYLCSSRIFHQFMLLPIIWIYQERCTVYNESTTKDLLMMGGARKFFYSGSCFLLAIWFICGRDRASRTSKWSVFSIHKCIRTQEFPLRLYSSL